MPLQLHVQELFVCIIIMLFNAENLPSRQSNALHVPIFNAY